MIPNKYQVSTYLLKVSNRNIRTWCETCSKLTIKTPKRRQWLKPLTIFAKSSIVDVRPDSMGWSLGLVLADVFMVELKIYFHSRYIRRLKVFTAGKVSVFGVFLVLISSHLDWMRRDTEYLSIFSLNARKYGPEKPLIQTLFTQWLLQICWWHSVLYWKCNNWVYRSSFE